MIRCTTYTKMQVPRCSDHTSETNLEIKMSFLSNKISFKYDVVSIIH